MSDLTSQELLDFIAEQERRHFRTHHDVGAHRNALFVWNQLRQFAGLEKLTMRDLVRRYAELDELDAAKISDLSRRERYLMHAAEMRRLLELDDYEFCRALDEGR